MPRGEDGVQGAPDLEAPGLLEHLHLEEELPTAQTALFFWIIGKKTVVSTKQQLASWKYEFLFIHTYESVSPYCRVREDGSDLGVLGHDLPRIVHIIQAQLDTLLPKQQLLALSCHMKNK